MGQINYEFGAIEAGADNCESAADGHTITCTVESFAAVRDALARRR